MGFGTVRRALGGCAEVRRRDGTGAMMRWIAYRSAQRLVDVRVGHVLWLEVGNINPSLRPEPAYTFQFLSAEEVRALSPEAEGALPPALADRIVADNDFCFAALAGPRLAAFGWFALGNIEPEHNAGTALSYPPDVAYMYNGYTVPDFRGQRLHGLVKALGLRALADRGVTRLLSTVDWTNGASLRSNLRLGCVDLGYAVLVRLGRIRLGHYPRAAKRLGVRFAKDAIRRAALPHVAEDGAASASGALSSPRQCAPGPAPPPQAPSLEWDQSSQPSESPPSAPTA